MTRRRPVRRLVEPWYERHHLYRRYAAFLDRLGTSGVRVLPLRELSPALVSDAPAFSLRHDVDNRLDSALVLAELERERGLRATYFVLHSAAYYDRPGSMEKMLRLQELGHEVGFHNDLVTLQVVRGVDSRAYLDSELARLRGAGLDIVGVAAHGSYWGHRLGYKNEYFFRGLDDPQPGFPNATRVGDVEFAKGTLEEFGFQYDASRLGETQYWTDSWVDAAGRRWHPDLVDLEALGPGDRAIALVHPCHWDATLGGKLGRTVGRLAVRTLRPSR